MSTSAPLSNRALRALRSIIERKRGRPLYAQPTARGRVALVGFLTSSTDDLTRGPAYPAEAFDELVAAGLIRLSEGAVALEYSGRALGDTGNAQVITTIGPARKVASLTPARIDALRLVGDGVVTLEWPLGIGKPRREIAGARPTASQTVALDWLRTERLTSSEARGYKTHAVTLTAIGERVRDLVVAR